MFKFVSFPMTIDVSPVNYTFKVQAMSSDKLSFIVPGLFIIGPCNDDDGLLKYATFVSARHMRCNHVEELVMDVIESEIRAIAALKTKEEIKRGAKKFKKQVLEGVQLELDQFGLQIYNANVKQLKEVPWYSVRLGGWRRPIKLLFSKLYLKSKLVKNRTDTWVRRSKRMPRTPSEKRAPKI